MQGSPCRRLTTRFPREPRSKLKSTNLDECWFRASFLPRLLADSPTHQCVLAPKTIKLRWPVAPGISRYRVCPSRSIQHFLKFPIVSERSKRISSRQQSLKLQLLHREMT